MRIRHSLVFAALALIVWSAPSFAARRFVRPLHVNKPVASEKMWTLVPQSVTSIIPEVEPNDDLLTANAASCGDLIRPAAIDVPDDIDWISFTANAGDLITLGTEADGASPIDDTIIGLFDAAGNQLVIDDDSGPGFYSLISSFPAPATGTYYFGIIAYDAAAVGTYQAFITCESAPAAPVNDQCAGAIALSCGTINLSGSTSGALNDYNPGTAGCTGYTAAGLDVVYQVTATPGQVLSLIYTSSADASLYIVTDCADPVGTCVAGADETVGGQAETLTYAFTHSGTYYVVLDSYGTSTFGSYTLTGSYECGAVGTSHGTWGKLKTIYR